MRRKQDSKVIALRVKHNEFETLLNEANQRGITLSELVRHVVLQRQESGGWEFEKRVVRMEEMIKKILYHSMRASLAIIAEYRSQKNDKEAQKIGEAIQNEIKKYQLYLKETGKEF